MQIEQLPRLIGRLYALRVGSPDPARLAKFAHEVLQMEIEPAGTEWICRGPERVLVYAPGSARSLLAAGYAVPEAADLAALRARLAAHAVALEAVPFPFFEDDAVAFRDPDGNCMVFGRPRAALEEGQGLPARLQHVVVASTDCTRMLEFYTRVVGFRISDRVEDEQRTLRTVFLRSDHEHHSLAIFQAAANGLDHCCFETTDWNLIRDWSDHFSEQGVMLQWGPGRHGPGQNLFVFVHDPDSNWLEISAELEVVRDPRPAGVWPHTERSLNQWGRAHLRS